MGCPGCATRTDDPASQRQIDFGVAVDVRVVLMEWQIALAVEQTVEYIRGVPVGTLSRQAVIRGVVVGDEAVELQRKNHGTI